MLRLQAIAQANSIHAMGYAHDLGKLLGVKGPRLDFMERDNFFGSVGYSVNPLNRVRRPKATFGSKNRKSVDTVVAFIPRILRITGCKCAHACFSNEINGRYYISKSQKPSEGPQKSVQGHVMRFDSAPSVAERLYGHYLRLLRHARNYYRTHVRCANREMQRPMQWCAPVLDVLDGVLVNPYFRTLGSCLVCRIYSVVDHGSIAGFCVDRKVRVPSLFGKRRTLAQRKNAAVPVSGLGKVVHIHGVALICINGGSWHFPSSGCEQAIVA
jgi:hypothetical protein